MQVNFNIRNHGFAHIQDFVDYIAAGVEDLGFQFALSTALQPDAINIMLEKFDDPAVLAEVEQACRRYPNMPFVVMATEIMQDNVFNSAGWRPGISDSSPYSRMDEWSLRTTAFRRLAPLMDAILCPSELLYTSYVAHGVGDRLHYLPLVYFDDFIQYRPERAAEADVDEDIDVLFSGVLTTRRENMLAMLQRHGCKVIILPPMTAEYVRHHFMRRAKVYLALKHYDDTRTLSKMRAYWSLCYGYYCLVETGTDPTDLDEHLQWFTTVDEVLEALALDRTARRSQAAAQRQRFRDSLTVNPFAAPLAPWLGAGGDRADHRRDHSHVDTRP